MKNKEILPHDHPTKRKNERLYFALTNHCNRECPWCSVYSSPRKSSFLKVEQMLENFPTQGDFEVQLEGGEPTTHPEFWDFIKAVRQNPRVSLLVLCTNGVLLPRSLSKLESYLDKIGGPLLIKLSLNHHLLERDPGLIDLCQNLRRSFESRPGCSLVLNVRRRKGVENDDSKILDILKANGLLDLANDFYLQRYGLASNQMEWDLPFVVRNHFTMINPDGSIFDGDLIARSEAMESLA